MIRHTEKNYSRKASKSLGIIGLLVLALGLFLPAQVFAQCNASMPVSFAGDEGPFELGEEIPIQLTVSMGEAEPPTFVNVSHFQFLMDCALTDIIGGGCTSQGNTVTFVGPVTTNCPWQGPPPPPDPELADTVRLPTERTGDTVDFYVRNDDAGTLASNSAIRLPSVAEDAPPNTCDVGFSVKIEALAEPSSTEPIVEFAVLAGQDAVCDNEDTHEETNALTIPIVNPNAIFWVTKEFSDDNKSPVDVHLSCDTGIYNNPDRVITGPPVTGYFQTVGFVVYGIPSIGANCRVFEKPVPSGYIDGYKAAAALDAQYDDVYDVNKGDKTDEARGCYYKAVKGGEYLCAITNEAKPAQFTVFKEWVIHGDGGLPVNEKAEITAFCNAPITKWKVNPAEEDEEAAAGETLNGSVYSQTADLGDGESLTVWAETLTGPVKCWAEENLKQSGVESIDDCAQQKTGIKAGGKAECTFVNTVFFEGIPTLNQYAMALMALLMLGFGVVSMRRFA